MALPQYRKVLRLARALGGVWTNWRTSRSAAAELAACDASGIQRMESDPRLSRENEQALADSSAGSSAPSDRRPAVDSPAGDATDRPAAPDMQRCCGACDRESGCQGKPDTTDPQPAKWPAYRLTAETLDALSSSCCH